MPQVIDPIAINFLLSDKGNPGRVLVDFDGFLFGTAINPIFVSGSGGGGTASAFGAPFPASGTAIGVKDSTGVVMVNLKATLTNELTTEDALLKSGAAKAQVAGTGTPGTPAAGVVTVQGIIGGTNLPITDNTTGTLNNGVETAVAAAAVSVLAANAARKSALVQNTGTANVRVGTTGVTATTGFRLVPGEVFTMAPPFDPVNAIFAIREGGTDSIVFALEVT